VRELLLIGHASAAVQALLVRVRLAGVMLG
jgi:hypothetical protein